MSTILVNGPVICFRLEGKIGNVDKVIYLFGDRHVNVDAQTECESYKSIDFVKYFVKTMKKTDKTKYYDLFFEVGSKEAEPWVNKYKLKYIHEFTKYFKQTINIVNNPDDKRQKTKNIGSKDEPNLLLHHIDIREYFYAPFIVPYSDSLQNIINNRIFNPLDITQSEVDALKNTLDILKTNLIKTTSLLLGEKAEIPNDDLHIKIKNISNKILDGYNNKQVKDILLNKTPLLNIIREMRTDVINEFENLMKIAHEFNELLDKNYNKFYKGKNFYEYGVDRVTKNKYCSKIMITGEKINTMLLDIYVFIMDLYFLRRFLDKDYITNAVAYTGYLHTFNYLFVMVKYFGFKITHCTNSGAKISEIESTIKKNEYDENIMACYMPEEFQQCIDMSSFPPKFE